MGILVVLSTCVCVRFAQCVSNLVVCNELLLVSLICEQDVGGHSCFPGQFIDQRSDDLVETFVHIDAGSCYVSSS